jgi:hypothetical protein
MSDKNDGLKVDAQGYGAGNYIKQILHPQGLRRAVTESVSPKYQERMETLREADKGMRETAGNLKGYLVSAQAAFKDNRYLDVAHWCSQIDAGVRTMIMEGKPVVDLRDAEIAEFYTRYEDAEPDHEYFSADDGLVSTAGIMDRLFGNSIEKLYWKKVKESKLAVQSLIKKAGSLIAIVLSSLGRMGDARAKGNISVWIEDLQRIGKAQSEFQVFARGVYEKHLKQLADIVKANRPKPAVQSPVNQSKSAPPASIPTADKAEEAEELVEEKPVVAPKKEPGRPTVDEAAKKKEMGQIEQLQNLLKNPVQPGPMIAGPDPVAPEVGATPEVKPQVEAPKSTPTAEVPAPIVPEAPKVIETPKAAPRVPSPVVNFDSQEKVPTRVAPIVRAPEAPKMPEVESIPEPFTESAPEIKSAPPTPTVAPSGNAVRGRGRPRMYPVGESPTDIKKRERLNRLNPNPKDMVVPEPPVARSVEKAPEVNKSVEAPSTAPKTNKSKSDKPTGFYGLDEKWKDLDKLGDKWDYTPFLNELRKQINTGKIKKPDSTTGGKMTLVLLPTIKPDNLDAIQDKLMKELGHPVQFVTKENGTQIAKDYIDAGWDIQGMHYEEVKAIEEKNKKNPLEMLNDPEFLASLPRLGNGEFNQQKLLNDEGEVLAPTKYPDFQNLDHKTRKAVIDKLLELEKDPKNIIIPVRKEKGDKPADAELPKEVNVQNPVEPTTEEDEPEEDSNSEEVQDMKMYQHGDEVEKLVGKSMKDITPDDVWKILMNSREYVENLPKMPGDKKKYDVNLIAKFPEVKLLKTDDFDGTKAFFMTLRGFEKGNPLPKAKDKVANVENAVIKYSHQKFFSELQKVANSEDYGLMAAMMCAYSEEIEKYDPETSIKLIQAAEKLI